MDFYTGLLSTGTEHLEEAIERLEQEVSLLKAAMTKPKEEEPAKKRLDGTC